MPRVLVLYYSMYGHVEAMAQAIAEGARAVAGADVIIKRVPELIPEDKAREVGVKLDQPAPLATPTELGDYDAVVFGAPTRYGVMSAQMRNFLDQTGSLWASNALVGKVGSAFTATATQHGGQETTLTSLHATLLHLGMIVVGVPYACADLSTMAEISGGSPYGATSISGPDGSRMPSERELGICRYQGRHVADIAARQAR